MSQPIRLPGYAAIGFCTLGWLMLAGLVEAHGFVTIPRQRGSLNTLRNIPNPVLDPSAVTDYCPHCLNCGGPENVRKGGPWKMFSPFDYERKGITMCGDVVGNDDHMRSGKFANPPSMPYAAKFKPGSVANLEYDVTAHHNGFLSFYLCDVSKSGDIRGDVAFFKENCYELERSPHASCETGNDKECGPIDPKYPGRWVLPCKKSAGDQMFGGKNGKMAYKIPNVEMKDAVIMAWWLTHNTCSTPDGFMQNYDYPSAWAGCTASAKPTFPDCITSGQTPEEFFNCADVQITGGATSGTTSAPATTAFAITAAATTAAATTDAENIAAATTAAATTAAATTAVATTDAATTAGATTDAATTDAATTAGATTDAATTAGATTDAATTDAATTDAATTDATTTDAATTAGATTDAATTDAATTDAATTDATTTDAATTAGATTDAATTEAATTAGATTDAATTDAATTAGATTDAATTDAATTDAATTDAATTSKSTDVPRVTSGSVKKRTRRRRNRRMKYFLRKCRQLLRRRRGTYYNSSRYRRYVKLCRYLVKKYSRRGEKHRKNTSTARRRRRMYR